MNTKTIVQALGLAALLGASAGAFAYGGADHRAFDNGAFERHPAFRESLRLMQEVDERQDRQMDRILSGLYEKRITLPEFRRLMDRQRDIQRMQRQFLADGLLSRSEYRKLDAALNAASRGIHREAHDARGRPAHGGGQGYR